MKVVLIGLMVTAVAGGLIGGGLFAYFSDVETGTHNTFTAGTIDIAVDGENPWNSSCTVSYPAGCEPGSEGCLTDFKPSEWGEIEFTISNVGTNTVDL